MSFQTPITLQKIIQEIEDKNYLLPAIQRELVWDSEQIEKLFDSILRGYPIGSFLFWDVKKHNAKKYQFYEFLTDYHEKKNPHNKKATVSGKKNILGILDGQQRLTAIYLGLKGSYAEKIPYKRWTSNDAFPKKYLFLNLKCLAHGTELEYDFQFLTRQEATKEDGDGFWFEVSKILDFDPERPNELYGYLVDCGLSDNKNKLPGEILFRLSKAIYSDKIINYYLEENESLDRVLNIFIRVNSAGNPLSYSDLLLSIATAQWQTKDAREEILNFVDEINGIGDDFDFTKDFVLKTCLVLLDFPDIAFSVDNFNSKNMSSIEKSWENITEAIKTAVQLISSFGFNHKNLTSNNAIIPICYFIYKNKNPKNFVSSSKHNKDRKLIKEWLLRALLKRVFGGHVDTVLSSTREVVKKNLKVFPYEKIIKKYKGTEKSLLFSGDEVDNLMLSKYGSKYTFSILSLLYPNLSFRNNFHQDHIFPKGHFSTNKKLKKKGVCEEDFEEFKDNCNYLGNLQLLEETPNLEKRDKDFEVWLKETCPDRQKKKDYMERHMIPDVELRFDNFMTFFVERNKILRKKLGHLLLRDLS